MPTVPREGSVHSDSSGGRDRAALPKKPLLYSYFQSGSSGCFKSQSGRRLSTTGILAKLYSGGGELVDHSSVQASHGSSPANFPFQSDHKRFPTKTRTPTIWKNTPIVTITFQISQPRPGS